MDVPGVESVEADTAGGKFDLRGTEPDYLGHVELDGRRVLEIGPASGFLTFYMEGRGADVVAVELGAETDWDIVPHAQLDLTAIRDERREVMRQLRNGFWWAHEQTRSRAKVHYGNVYALPDELGSFDVALMASVLRHTRDPLRILEGCARHAQQLVITEMYTPELDGSPIARLVPSRDSVTWDTWWDLSPDLLSRFVEVLGFDELTVSHHRQRFLLGDGEHEIPFFTLVAGRTRAGSD
ncbi:MAG TPA: class I SAM-dependent methyltransferase [Solirubrobacteraceae bacterium]|nr:class I SAM-dependent methyltransferase [Solirubrobacteraceae bacterium]